MHTSPAKKKWEVKCKVIIMKNQTICYFSCMKMVTRSESKAESTGTKKVNFPAQESVLVVVIIITISYSSLEFLGIIKIPFWSHHHHILTPFVTLSHRNWRVRETFPFLLQPAVRQTGGWSARLTWGGDQVKYSCLCNCRNISKNNGLTVQLEVHENIEDGNGM